jgi:hypothetical protein
MWKIGTPAAEAHQPNSVAPNLIDALLYFQAAYSVGTGPGLSPEDQAELQRQSESTADTTAKAKQVRVPSLIFSSFFFSLLHFPWALAIQIQIHIHTLMTTLTCPSM